MKHPTTIKYKGGLKKLAEDVCNLRYDALQDFFAFLQEKLKADSNKDKDAGKAQLADVLKRASDHVGVTGSLIGDAWDISKPHMKLDDLNDTCEKCGRVYCDHESKY